MNPHQIHHKHVVLRTNGIVAILRVACMRLMTPCCLCQLFVQLMKFQTREEIVKMSVLCMTHDRLNMSQQAFVCCLSVYCVCAVES